MDVVVLHKRASGITVVLGKGQHSMKCELSPTRNGLVYVGSVMGRGVAVPRGLTFRRKTLLSRNEFLRHH
jgi:hypothetical protein